MVNLLFKPKNAKNKISWFSFCLTLWLLDFWGNFPWNFGKSDYICISLYNKNPFGSNVCYLLFLWPMVVHLLFHYLTFEHFAFPSGHMTIVISNFWWNFYENGHLSSRKKFISWKLFLWWPSTSDIIFVACV